METTATVQVPLSEIARRKAIIYLKGFIIGNAVKKGFKWTSKHPATPLFDAALADGKSYLYGISIAHILYNRIRQTGRSHFANRECDQAYLDKHGVGGWMVMKTLEHTGYDLKGVAK